MPRGSSLTKFAAITIQSRVCVLVFWGCSAVAREEEVRDSLGVLQEGKTLPPEFANASASVPECGTPSRDQAVLWGRRLLGGRAWPQL